MSKHFPTSRQRWTIRIKRVLRAIHAWKEVHVAVTFLAFGLAVYGLHHLGLLLEGLVCLIFLFGAVCFLPIILARRFAHPVKSPANLKHILGIFLKIPKYQRPHLVDGRYTPYRIRLMETEEDVGGLMVPSEDDLSAFVDLSHQTLAEAHPTFGIKQRRELYLRWWKCNPNAFLLLDKKMEDGSYKVIATSIMLPLSVEGHHELRGARTSVLQLRGQDVVPPTGSTKHLLIDTWIVHPFHRHSFTGYEAALIMKHLSMFWHPLTQPEMTILIEPDVDSVHRLAIQSGFSGPRKTADGGKLYACHFPYDYADDRLASIHRSLQDKLVECSAWVL